MKVRTTGVQTYEVTLELRHLFLLCAGSAISLFLLFCAGVWIGKSLVPSRDVQTTVTPADRHLDCLDWLATETKEKTAR